MGFSGKILLEDSAIVESVPREGTTFDDPPGRSPSRWVSPIFDRDLLVAELASSLRRRVTDVQVAGTCSGAYTGESFEILLVILGVIGSGILGAIGKDIWDAIKRTMARTVKRAPRRTLVEVALQFKECDVILHAKSRNAGEVPALFDDADAMLEELKVSLTRSRTLPQDAETIEIRVNSSDDQARSVLYSYRRARFMMERIASSAQLSKGQGPRGENQMDKAEAISAKALPGGKKAKTRRRPPAGKEAIQERARRQHQKRGRKGEEK